MKAMPPFIAFQVHDATGAADRFDWIRPLVDRGWRPHVGVLTEEIHENEWHTMASLAESGHVEWFPQALTAQRGIYYHHPSGRPYSDDEVRLCMAQAKARFEQYGIPIARSLVAHRGEYGRNAVPLLTEWNVRYSLCRFIPNEPDGGDHLNWEPEPYGHTGYILDNLFGFPALFVAAASSIPRSGWRYVDEAKTRYRMASDWPSDDRLWEPAIGQARTQDMQNAQAQAAVRMMRIGLDSRFYGAITMSERTINAFSLNEWERFIDDVDTQMEGLGTIRMSQDFICAYAQDKVRTHLACVDYDLASDTLRVVLSGKADRPLHLQVFDDECRERVVAIDAFEGRVEQICE
jgi:hypothetical protein